MRAMKAEPMNKLFLLVVTAGAFAMFGCTTPDAAGNDLWPSTFSKVMARQAYQFDRAKRSNLKGSFQIPGVSGSLLGANQQNTSQIRLKKKRALGYNARKPTLAKSHNCTSAAPA